MVPMLQTKGTVSHVSNTETRNQAGHDFLINDVLIEYALAIFILLAKNSTTQGSRARHTLMLWLCDEFTNHGLNNTDIAVQKPADGTTKHSHPDIGREPNHDHAEHGADTS